ncbi:hypothetical protein KSB_17820 [Ktedonobacter robiniae]|uniref:Uncharacterized protein n=1 Tax=Ktedonobacter robiniae TaxID=2778365 RepID=A0ABQ3ULL9_9CHLR|nr:hypothetical protein KSB_17820 [Ktedonobacter robiniae]
MPWQTASARAHHISYPVMGSMLAWTLPLEGIKYYGDKAMPAWFLHFLPDASVKM